MTTILVTGATGTVGCEVARLLGARGLPVRAALCDPGGAVPAGVAPVPFDFGRPETYDLALRGVEALFLMRPPAITDTRRYVDPLIAAAREAGVRRVVFLSVLGAERLPVVPHRRIERSLEASGMAHTFLRPSFFMQNLSGVHRADIRRGHIVVPAGHGATSFVDARDIAAVAALALVEPGHEGRAYALTGADALDYYRVAEVFTETLGRAVTYADPTIAQFVAQMRREGLAPGLVLTMVGIYTTARLGLAAAVTDDVARLLDRPPIALRRFVADYRACWAWTSPRRACDLS